MFNLRKLTIWKSLLFLAGLYAAAAVLTMRPGDRALYPARGDGITVYVINNGFHTDIAIPADRIMARGGVLAKAGKAVGQKRWLYYGWGDAGFYTGSGLSLARITDGARALFMPNNPSVIRVFGLDRNPEHAFVDPIAEPVVLSPAGFDALTRHMEASFVTHDATPVEALVSADTGVFFVSREHFSALRVCNNWTSDQLAAAGLPTAPVIDWAAPLFKLDLRLRSGVKRQAD